MSHCAPMLSLEDAIASLFDADHHRQTEHAFQDSQRADFGSLVWWEEDEVAGDVVQLNSNSHDSEGRFDDSDTSYAGSPLSADDKPVVSGSKPLKYKKRQAKIQGSVQKRWSKDEHERFLEGLARYCPYADLSREGDEGRVFVGLGPGIAQAIACMVGTRTELQVRSHAQKYFLKQSIGKCGRFPVFSEHVPSTLEKGDMSNG
eukprot:767617-Hanusia_phi.AAC.4